MSSPASYTGITGFPPSFQSSFPPSGQPSGNSLLNSSPQYEVKNGIPTIKGSPVIATPDFQPPSAPLQPTQIGPDMATLSSQRVTSSIGPDGKLILTPDSKGNMTFNDAILQHLGKLPVTSSPPVTTPPATSSLPATSSTSSTSPPTTSSSDLPSNKVEGIHVPHDPSSFNTITNTTLHAIPYPIWVTVKEVYGEYVEIRTSSGLLRTVNNLSVNNIKPQGYKVLGHVFAWKERAAFPPDEPPFNIEKYKNYYNCKKDNLKECMKICENAGQLSKYMKVVTDTGNFDLLQKNTKKKGGKKNIYSRRKLNKTKGKRKTTKRRRSRRNIIRKTKKMYK